MRPRGLGLRLKSRHVQPNGVDGWGGARWPLTVVLLSPLTAVDSSGTGDLASLPALAALLVRCVRAETARVSMGERLRVRALRSSGPSESSSSACRSRDFGAGVRLRAAERVTGPV